MTLQSHCPLTDLLVAPAGRGRDLAEADALLDGLIDPFIEPLEVVVGVSGHPLDPFEDLLFLHSVMPPLGGRDMALRLLALDHGRPGPVLRTPVGVLVSISLTVWVGSVKMSDSANPNLMLCAYCGRRYPRDSDSFPVLHYAECVACVKKRTCKHETVDELRVEFRRKFRSYREECLDCDSIRRREPGRWRMGRWSVWA